MEKTGRRIRENRNVEVHLKQDLSFLSGLSLVVGNIIGVATFISPKGILRETGSVGLCLTVWAVASGLSLLGALSYVELGSMLSRSGGEYVYLKAAMGKPVAYMFAWTKIMILIPSDVAVCSLTFAQYLNTLFSVCGKSVIADKIIAVFVILTICIVNCQSTKLAARVQVVFTVTKVIIIGLLFVGGVIWNFQGHTEAMQSGFQNSTGSASGIARAFYYALYAFEGWNSLAYVLEELKTPKKNLPRGSAMGILIAVILYQAIMISYLSVLGVDGVLESDAVAVSWGEAVFESGPGVLLIRLGVLITILGSTLGTLFAGSRVLYVASRDKQFPEVLSYVHCRLYTPVPCILFSTVLSMVMLIPGNIEPLINFYSFSAWIFYSLSAISLLILRVKMKDTPRPYKVNILVPILFLLCSAFLVIAPIVQNPSTEYLYAVLVLCGGLLFYYPLVKLRRRRSCFDSVTLFLQLFMEVIPSPCRTLSEEHNTRGKE